MANIVGKTKPDRDIPVKTAKRVFRHENAALAVILVALIGIFGVLTKGASLSMDNIYNILVQISWVGVAAVGQGMIILTRNIDLSVAGVGTCCLMLGGTMMTSYLEQNIVGYPVSPYIVIPLMLLMGTAFGLVSGALVSRVGVPALIVTLGMWQISNGIAYQMTAGRPIIGLPESISFIGLGTVSGVPIPVIVLFSVIGVTYFVLHHTTFGKQVHAVGGNPVSAWFSGINVRNVVLKVFIIGGFLYALSGLISTSHIMAATMVQLRGLELDTIAAAFVGGISIVGGVGTIIGVLLGATIIGVVNNGLSIAGVASAMMAITKGAIIITAVTIDYMRRR